MTAFHTYPGMPDPVDADDPGEATPAGETCAIHYSRRDRTVLLAVKFAFAEWRVKTPVELWLDAEDERGGRQR